jgi:hypothetical protein
MGGLSLHILLIIPLSGVAQEPCAATDTHPVRLATSYGKYANNHLQNEV